MIEDWNDYQERTRATAIYPGARTKLGLLYATLGLTGETGEVAEHGKKAIRDDGGQLTRERHEKIVKELGDVCWYCAAIAHEARFKLERARITRPENAPEPRTYVGRGTVVGFGYVCARTSMEVGKLVEQALYVMPYTVPDGSHWSDVGQGRVVRARLVTAVGRVLFYAERVAAEAGTTLEFVMSENIAKLKSRKERDVLHGEGSDR